MYDSDISMASLYLQTNHWGFAYERLTAMPPTQRNSREPIRQRASVGIGKIVPVFGNAPRDWLAVLAVQSCISRLLITIVVPFIGRLDLPLSAIVGARFSLECQGVFQLLPRHLGAERPADADPFMLHLPRRAGREGTMVDFGED